MTDVHEIATPDGYERFVPEVRHLNELAALAAELAEVKKDREDYSMLAAQLRTRNRELEAEVEALKHDLEKSMANHVADINGSASETEAKS